MALFIGFILDFIFGDPHWMPHPIRFIGWLISKSESVLRKIFPKSKQGEYISGVILTFWVMAISTAIPLILLLVANRVSPYLRLIVESIMCYQILATKALKTESMKVHKELISGDLQGARKMVSMIVGRDTERLNASQVAKAAVETVAENTSDGIVAPLLFMAIGAAPLGFLYKSINTMDSMIGYKNDTYINFGRFAAKLDDVVNWIPARLSAYLMIVSAFILKFDFRNAYRIYKRDRYNHSSPNSAHTEAVCAGALNVQLAGDAYYFGKLYKKQTIGDDIRSIETKDIVLANRLMYATAIISFIIFAAVKLIICLLLK